MSANIAKSGFRRLMRSSKAVFGKDLFAYNSARAQLKIEFMKNQSIDNPQILGNIYNYYLINDQIPTYLICTLCFVS